MKRWIILAVLIVTLSAVATVAVQYIPGDSDSDEVQHLVGEIKSGPQPEVFVETPLIYKFTSKPQFETFSHDWVIKNKGQGDLVLHLQGTTCSCTVAEFPKGAESDTMTVKPGEETTVHLTFETRTSEGKFQKSATMGTNDPKMPSITFATDGEVHPAIVTYPPEKVVMFTSISNEVDNSARVAMFSPDRPDLKIIKVTTTKPGFVTGEPAPMNEVDRMYLKTKSGFRINIHVKPGMPLGQFNEILTIHTDHPKQPEIKLQVVGKVVGPIAILPDHLTLPNIPGKQGGQGEVTISVRGKRDTTFKIEQRPKNVEVAISATDPVNKKGVYKMTVTIPPGTSPGQIDDQIVLSTDHPKASLLRIPLQVFVHGPS